MEEIIIILLIGCFLHHNPEHIGIFTKLDFSLPCSEGLGFVNGSIFTSSLRTHRSFHHIGLFFTRFWAMDFHQLYCHIILYHLVETSL